MASRAAANKFSWNQVFLQWSVGMLVSTPLIAIVQGTLLLSDYRNKHRDAPRPVMPARGVAVAVDNKGGPPRRVDVGGFWKNNDQQPLRLLVVGDSLAAGVGMSKSGTPVLPESIARALSQACGGRAVYWTCLGTPGVSASQIVQDIHQLQPHQPGLLEKLLREWQAKRRKWQQRREKLRGRLSELESLQEDNYYETDILSNKNYFQDWWQQIRRQETKTPSQIRDTTERVLREWWAQVTNRLQATKQRVEEDLTEIKEIVQSTEENDLEEAEAETEEEDALIHRGNMFRRDSVDPEVVAQYDIAVVLTGLNDLKDAFMPHMTKGGNSSMQDETERIVGGLEVQLQRVLQALGEKMDRMDLETKPEPDISTGSAASQKPDTTHKIHRYANLRRPLVVVPELPVAPLQLFRTVPLSWFLIPLFRAMENNKKFLSRKFPDYVVFIPQPDLQWWSDVEAGLGPIRQNLREEHLLLRRTDIAQKARKRIQELMKEHYDPGDDNDETEEAAQEGRQIYRHRDEHHLHHPHHHTEHHVVPNTAESHQNAKSNGSPFVAIDKMHPNDEGYELWGRHIAAAIVQQWNR